MSSFNILKNHRHEKYLFRKHLLIISIFVLILFSILLVRLFYLQIWQHKLYNTLSAHNHLSLLPIEPNRGLIFDRNGVILAKNIPVFSLDILPGRIKEFTADLAELQRIIPIDSVELEQFNKIYPAQHLRPTPLKLNLSEEEVAKVYLNQYRLPELKIEARLMRYYPQGENMASVLGYMGRINTSELKDLDSANYSASNFIGKIGIEKYYEDKLHGITGYQQVEIDAAGHIVRILKRIAPISGDNLHLTLDSKLQMVAKEALGIERGAVVIIKPENGEILALVSNPSYDPNQFVVGISAKSYKELSASADKPIFNRAISGQFPPGSTIKPFIALRGLDDGLIDEEYTIDDPGWFKLPHSKHIYRDWVKHGHGRVNVINALIVSCDTFFYNLAKMLGINAIDDILYQFGFGAKTGIDLGEEVSGNVPSPNWKVNKVGIHWYSGDTVISGIGQGYLLVTPLQLAYGVATIANRGLRFKPHLLLKTQNTQGISLEVKSILDKPVRLKDEKNWDIIIEGMRGVIESVHPWGTGRIRFGGNAPYTVAAKTGHAQLYHRLRNDENEAWEEANVAKNLRNHTLFIAFSPIEKPELAIAVVVENSVIAGSVARKILDYYHVSK